jgi:hypothetical protein
MEYFAFWIAHGFKRIGHGFFKKSFHLFFMSYLIRTVSYARAVTRYPSNYKVFLDVCL